MSKRFFDTGVFKKPWFRRLSAEEKAAWFYIQAECDNVGVWDADTDVAEFVIGGSLDWDSFATKCNGNLHILPNGKWWLVDYCIFQHPDMVEDSKSNAIQSYIKLLKKHGLWEAYMARISTLGEPLVNPCATLGEPSIGGSKAQVRERERELLRAADNFHPVTSAPMNATTYAKLVDDYGQDTVDAYFQRVSDYCAAKGKCYKDHAAAVRRWLDNDGVAKRKKPKTCPKCGVQRLGTMGYCHECGTVFDD